MNQYLADKIQAASELVRGAFDVLERRLAALSELPTDADDAVVAEEQRFCMIAYLSAISAQNEQTCLLLQAQLMTVNPNFEVTDPEGETHEEFEPPEESGVDTLVRGRQRLFNVEPSDRRFR